MNITVKLFASLARFFPDGLAGTPFILQVPEASTIKDVVDQLGIPFEETRVSFVNGIIHDQDWALTEGDELGIFPPIGGG